MNDYSDPWTARPLPKTSPVPPRYHGVWSRTLLDTPALRDDTTFVRWMQLGRWHADLRIPAGVAAGAAARTAEGQRALLATQQGFAGLTQVTMGQTGEVCSWHRLVDYQLPGPHPDAGVMVFESPDCVIETGIHGVYREVWRLLPGSSSPLIALARAGRSREKSGVRIFIAGSYLMRVEPQPSPSADFEISFGRLDKSSRRWTIEHSTLPGLMGQKLVFLLERSGQSSAEVQLGGASGLWDVLDWDETSSHAMSLEAAPKKS